MQRKKISKIWKKYFHLPSPYKGEGPGEVLNRRSRLSLFLSLFTLVSLIPLTVYLLRTAGFSLGWFRNTDPIAYWSFDEGTGTIAHDSSANRSDGAITGAAWQTDDLCISGNCLYFNGTSNYVTVPTNNLNTSTGTLSLWAKSTSTDLSTTRMMFSHLLSGSTHRLYLSKIVTTGHLAVGLGDTSNFDTGWTFNTNSWHHLILVWDNGTYNMFLDGKLINSGSYTNFSSANTTALIGAWTTSSQWWQGFIDEVKIYDYARTEQEVLADYNLGAARLGKTPESPAFANGLVSYWKMDEASWNGTAGEVKDSSGNNLNGTSSCYNTNCSRLVQGPGKFGNGGNFDNIDDEITMGNPALLNFGSDSFTFTGWIKLSGANDRTIIDKGNIYQQASVGYDWLIVGGKARLALSDGTNGHTVNTAPQATSNLSNNTWYFVSVSYNSSTKKVNYYLNGASDGGYTAPANLGSLTNNGTFFIGAKADTRFFGGAIDEIRVYNRVLSLEEINDLYNWAPGPIAQYKFEEGSGNTAIDSSGNGNNGTWSGIGKHYANGIFSKAAQLNGINDQVTIGSSGLSTITKQGTIEGWFTTPGYDSSIRTLIDLSGTGCSNGAALFAWHTGFSKPTFQYGDGTTCRYLTTINSPSKNAWHHLSVSWDSSGIFLYLDGTLQSSNLTNVTSIVLPSNIYLGSNGGSTRYHLGNLDDVKIYNYARTPAQILADYSVGASHESPLTSTTTMGQNSGYCIPGDTAPCSPPVAEYKFEEGAGNTVTDTSGNNNHGTLFNNPRWTSGKIGKALSFNGTNNYVNIPNSPSINISNQLTLQAWVKWNRFKDHGPIIHKAPTGGTINLQYSLWSYANNRVMCYLANGTNYNSVSFTSAQALSTNIWHHITCSITGSKLNLYVDGALVGQANQTITGYTTDSPITISNPSYVIDGDIDDVRIFNYARTPAQIAWDYNRGAPIAHWKFDECQGVTAHDSSGNNLHGTISIGSTGSQNAAGSCDSTGAWANGKSGQLNSAMSFDGTDDIIAVNNNSLLKPTSAFSISLWLKTTQTGNRVILEADGNSGYSIQRDLDDTLKMNVGTSNTEIGTSKTYHDGKWHHLVFIYHGPNNGAVYVDGINDTASNNPGAPSYSTGNFYIGSRQGLIAPYAGQIDDVQLFNYPLTPEQIKLLYNNGAVNFSK